MSTHFRKAIKVRREQLIRELLKLNRKELNAIYLDNLLLSDLEKELKEQLESKGARKK
ncbi:hypothetical protein [Sutcliffiella rhizosphaerae]|uniref:Fur-regulated basic protein B n=1 Tax=Sutcliffiella rhizosphaerae TaxID=2880967 RepID=A0ABN8AFG5_9BACI|nr:hypothetical protein [Sutcliffiella rhizosphaerae]CAG9622467.1 hypothetical protein BACCIP111883_03258 [Sutcliffiella rhizosphaerae]